MYMYSGGLYTCTQGCVNSAGKGKIHFSSFYSRSVTKITVESNFCIELRYFQYMKMHNTNAHFVQVGTELLSVT